MIAGGVEALRFGAVVLVSPHDADSELRAGLEARGYFCSHFEAGERFYAPYAMGLQNRYLFLPKDAV